MFNCSVEYRDSKKDITFPHTPSFNELRECVCKAHSIADRNSIELRLAVDDETVLQSDEDVNRLLNGDITEVSLVVMDQEGDESGDEFVVVSKDVVEDACIVTATDAVGSEHDPTAPDSGDKAVLSNILRAPLLVDADEGECEKCELVAEEIPAEPHIGERGATEAIRDALSSNEDEHEGTSAKHNQSDEASAGISGTSEVKESSNSFDSFLCEVQPLIDTLLTKLESNPQHLSRLQMHMNSTLANRNWGITVLPNASPQVRPGSSASNRTSTSEMQTHPVVKWNSVICDGCERRHFTGPRYKCLSCPDYDLCGRCFENRRDVHDTAHGFEELKNVKDVWVGVSCDGCGRRGFAGKRYKCSECRHYDLCENCYSSLRTSTLHVPWHTFTALDPTSYPRSTRPLTTRYDEIFI
ncbi:uncharacterized protein SPPG_07709 [Spizellomyces punctatus DAOM BR117]|uniref:ZZ-type domain-containing protein n=1 Tax=Spizellomyces punctatus (strain DAOM BR117) TaxID=645134 RepID=A0A0L0H7D7_SPIPD|nr:uncharacterized protein SPPG_07709 [Spizellomyces punctatus DAOM BR117]KNC96879.1 hypothetical protein SPPG_07709 [Spizellomyces punctatus DAOM BR117]|eukprot:XP_016604919.1 hypothetical protein SPPG_07709 [Spizellomyces punctatus DAOM BR117]